MSQSQLTIVPADRAEERPAPARPRPSYRLDESVGHLLRRAHQRHAALFQERGAVSGLTSTQFATLLRLSELGTATQNALGRAVALDPATIQGVVARLRDRGLVEAGRDPLDRRTVVLSLNEAGTTALAEAVRQGSQANERLLAPLTAEERRMLIRLLRRLLG